MSILEQFSDLHARFFARKDILNAAQEIAEKLETNIAWIEQVHGDRSIVVRDALNATEKADGIATDQKNLALIIQVADCQAFLFYDPTKKILSLLHAGWRGLASNAIQKHIDLLSKTWNTDPHDLFVYIAPSICAACYEFKGWHDVLPAAMHPYVQNDHLDLMSCANDQLKAADILQDHIERSPDCTCHMASSYWSWRAKNTGPDAPKEDRTKRNYLVAMLKTIS